MVKKTQLQFLTKNIRGTATLFLILIFVLNSGGLHAQNKILGMIYEYADSAGLHLESSVGANIVLSDKTAFGQQDAIPGFFGSVSKFSTSLDVTATYPVGDSLFLLRGNYWKSPTGDQFMSLGGGILADANGSAFGISAVRNSQGSGVVNGFAFWAQYYLNSQWRFHFETIQSFDIVDEVDFYAIEQDSARISNQNITRFGVTHFFKKSVNLWLIDASSATLELSRKQFQGEVWDYPRTDLTLRLGFDAGNRNKNGGGAGDEKSSFNLNVAGGYAVDLINQTHGPIAHLVTSYSPKFLLKGKLGVAGLGFYSGPFIYYGGGLSYRFNDDLALHVTTNLSQWNVGGTFTLDDKSSFYGDLMMEFDPIFKARFLIGYNPNKLFRVKLFGKKRSLPIRLFAIPGYQSFTGSLIPGAKAPNKASFEIGAFLGLGQ